MQATDITNALFRHFNANKGYKYQLCNAYVWAWESDFFCIARSGVVYEIEVKVSRGDFFADFKKDEKHKILAHNRDWFVKRNRYTDLPMDPEEYFKQLEDPNKHWFPARTYVQFHQIEKLRPNKFAFAVPKGLVSEDEVPDYAGLITINESGHPRIVKAPPMLHKTKADLTKVLLDKYYWAYLRMLDQTDAGKNFKLVGEES